MEIITLNFITFVGYKKSYPRLGEHEIKGMITTSMLKRQVWMADDDEFDHIVEYSQRVLNLNAQYENHPYVEEFAKECSAMFVYGTYVLEGEADAKFSLGKIWNLLQGGPLTNNPSNFCRKMINSTRAWNYIQKISGSLLNIEIIKSSSKHTR